MKKYIMLLAMMFYVFLGVNVLFAATYNQSDLTGKWQMHLLRTAAGTGTKYEWQRAVLTFDASGILTAASGCLDSGGDTSCPPLTTTTAKIDENGLITISTTGGHFTMAANKKLIAGTTTDDSGNAFNLFILQKAAVSYTPGLVANQPFVYHQLRVGVGNAHTLDTWIRGAGYTDASGNLYLSQTSALTTGDHDVQYMGTALSVDAGGNVTAPGVTNFHGFLSDDLKTIVATHGNASEGYHLMVIQVTGRVYPVGPVPAGTSANHMLASGSLALWAHYITMVESGGVMKRSQWATPFGGTAPELIGIGSINASGTVTIDTSPTYHGQASDDGAFTVGTQTSGTDPNFVYSLNVSTKSAPDFRADVANVYYSDAIRTVNNYNFSTGTRSGDFIAIPAGFVTTTDGLAYVYGLFPGSKNYFLGWNGSVATLGTLRTDERDGAAIITTTTAPDPSTAQIAWNYKIKLQNFVVTDNVYERIAAVGMGSDAGGLQPEIATLWAPGCALKIKASVGGHDDDLWSTEVSLGAQTPSNTVLELRLQNTGTAINFYYSLNGGAETLIGTFGSAQGYVAANYKGFPVLFPFCNLEVEDNFEVYSFHQNNAGGNKYYANINVDDPAKSYNSVSAEITNGCGTLASTALTYNNGRWGLSNTVVLSENTPPPCYPTFKITADPNSGIVGDEIVAHRSINNYVVDFAINVQPTGSVTFAPTYTWTGIVGARGYWVQVNDSQYGFQIWGKWVDATVGNTYSLPYDGPALTSGKTYYYSVNAQVGNGSSVAEASFTYSGSTLYAKFANAGIWKYSNTGTDWIQVTASNPQLLVTVGTTLYGTFPGLGIWKFDGTNWTQTTTSVPQMIVGSSSTLYGAFSGLGIWQWNGTEWKQSTTSNPQTIIASTSDLYGTFAGLGIWKFNGTEWNSLTTSIPDKLVTSGVKLYGAFSGQGIWLWNGTEWKQATTSNPQLIAANSTKLYGSFAGAGIWSWDGDSTWVQISPDTPTQMVASGMELYAVFAGVGIKKWDGTAWSLISGNEPAGMVVGE